MRLLTLFSALCVMLGGCTGGTGTGAPLGGDTLTSRAECLTVIDFPDYTLAEVTVPWIDRPAGRYAFAKHSGGCLPDGYTPVAPGPGGIVSFSNIFNAAIDRLGALEMLGGVTDTAYLAPSDTVRALIACGQVAVVGTAMSPSVEHIIDLQPGAVLAAPYESNPTQASLRRAGLPVVLMADYLENDPRGRLEWLMLLGLCTGRLDSAKAQITRSLAHYETLKSLASKAGHRPAVITDKPLGGVWYVPGGDSYVARLIEHAGARYPWTSVPESNTLPMSIEAVLEEASKADFWLVKDAYDITAQSLTRNVPHLDIIKPFPSNTWVSNTVATPYYDAVAFMPEQILADIISIVHPELCGDSIKPRFYTPIK